MRFLNGTFFYQMNDKKQRSIYWKLTYLIVMDREEREREEGFPK
jgi:hypothetical protein